MAKSKGSFGRFIALATLAGAVAAGISYFTKYRSFHKELEEDFHDFEEDDNDSPIDSTMSRNYVPINADKAPEEPAPASAPITNIEMEPVIDEPADISEPGQHEAVTPVPVSEAAEKSLDLSVESGSSEPDSAPAAENGSAEEEINTIIVEEFQ